MVSATLALLSAMCGGIAHVLARRLVGMASARDMVAFNFGLMTVMLLPGAPFFWQLSLDRQGLALVAGAAFVDAAANYCYFRAFERLSAAVVSSLLAFSPVFVLALAPVMGASNGGLTAWQISGILLAAAGLWMAAQWPRPGGDSRLPVPSRKEMFWPLAAAALFGVGVYLLKQIFTAQYANPYTYYLVRAPLIAVLTAIITRPNFSWLRAATVGLTAGRLVFVIAQWLLLLSALQIGIPAVVKALADLSPFFVIVIGWAILRERPSVYQTVGAIVIVISMALISLE